MQADAYRRAKTLLSSPRDLILARILGFVQSLLLVALLGLIALLVAVLASRGEARFPASKVKDLPAGFASLTTGREFEEGNQFLLFDHTGVFPLITGNLLSDNWVHRTGARALDRITRFIPTLLNNMGALTTLLAMGSACIVLIALVAIWRRSVIAKIATEVATALRRQIHRQMYRLGQSSLPTEGVGPVVNLWTREVNDVRDGLIADLDATPRVQVLAVGLLVFALLVSPLLTVFLASLGLVVWWLTARVLNRDTRQATEAALRDASLQLCLLHEDLGLLRTVRIYGVEDYDRQRFDEHLDRYQKADTRRIVTSGALNPSTGLLYGAALAIALGVLGYSAVVNDRISIATMLILLVSLGGLAQPIMEWLSMRKAIRQANRSHGIFEFLERRPELHQNVGAHFLNALKEQISFEDVELESRSGRRLLDGVSAEIPAGTRTAIIGADDDEKLALVCLIPRLIDPRVGRVQIDGHDLRDVTLDSVRLQVATVLQADLVFTDSVLANIGLGDPLHTLPRIIEAAKVAHAHYFIQDLPHGYDTTIGPLGHYLKPDEQFRIALARAFLHDPSILIVEEPNTPIDDDTKHFLDDTLARMSIGRTLIVIPHRLSTLRASDHVIVLHNGRVEEAGSPEQLRADSKLFRHLLYSEFNEFAGGEIEAGQMEHREPVRKSQ